jgi:Dyp-type peroxidase family
MTQCFITIVIPHKAVHSRLDAYLIDNWHNPAEASVQAQLDDLGIVHFMSIVAIPPDNGGPCLIMEITADGNIEYVLNSLADALRSRLTTLLAFAGVRLGRKTLAQFLIAQHVPIGQGYFGATGLAFSGTPGMTVRRILREGQLASDIKQRLESEDVPRALTPREKLEAIRTWLWDEGQSSKWAFVEEPIAWETEAHGVLHAVEKGAWPVLRDLLWPVAILPLTAPLLAAGGAYALYRRLRALETHDPADSAPPDARVLEQIVDQEDHYDQNHLIVLTALKPQRLRKLTLRIALFSIAQAATNVFRPGFLSDIGTIHSARWIVLPGGTHMVFFSNYDGSWQSYLEDFINEAHEGLTGVWSNTEGFPRANNLFLGGATDGSRFKRWARRHQALTPFWYSAYPKLTTARIRSNAAIRRGVASAHTDAQAAEWLAHFGAPTPERSGERSQDQAAINDRLGDLVLGPAEPPKPIPIEREQIPALAFGGLPRLLHGCALLVRFDDAEQAQRVVHTFRADVDLSFGEDSARKRTLSIGLSASGLRKLGVGPASMATFPVAFQHGSARRARPLGDVGDDAPQYWRWGSETEPVDAVFLIHAERDADVEQLASAIVDAQCTVVARIEFQPRTQGSETQREPFGFVDGISQPLINGLRASGDDKRRDNMIEAGEIVLGYPDGLGITPLTAAIDEREGRGPKLTEQERNLGRNGTFLVVRQLEQNVAGFRAFLSAAAEVLPADATPHGVDREAWVAAKLLGRWENGSSLVRNPHGPAPDDARPDNDFLYGSEDPDGLRCPFGAHIRRANPRDSFSPGSSNALSITNRHRILRVGRVYSEADGEAARKQGLLFMCLNADIERQFEFIQQTWVRAPSFMGLAGEVDPILAPSSDPNVQNSMTIPTERGPLAITGFGDFVRVLGSGYFFLPSKSALEVLRTLRGELPVQLRAAADIRSAAQSG